jgi:hypothetical protein
MIHIFFSTLTMNNFVSFVPILLIQIQKKILDQKWILKWKWNGKSQSWQLFSLMTVHVGMNTNAWVHALTSAAANFATTLI